MKQLYTSAAEAMRAAFELSKLLGRPVWRHMGVDRRGTTVWVVSLDNNAQSALREVLA